MHSLRVRRILAAMGSTLLSLGHGYVAAALARRLGSAWQVIGTVRSPARAEQVAAAGAQALVWPGDDLSAALARATHLLCSVPPEAGGADPALAALHGALDRARHLRWVGYLSTTGVYGDAGGAWVDEATPPAPASARGRARLAAETGWLGSGLPVHIFRLAGIYGPGRSPFARIRAGTAQRIIKPGQVFNRAHVDDIAQVLAASIARPAPGTIYNVADDLPAPPEDVLAHAAALIGAPLPPAVPFDNAQMGEMARSFYSEAKRVRNDRIKAELGVLLAYPTYREGLAAALAAEGATPHP